MELAWLPAAIRIEIDKETSKLTVTRLTEEQVRELAVSHLPSFARTCP